MKLSSSKGITLIELLVIVAILSIFSGIGFATFTSFDSASNFQSNKQEVINYLNNIRLKAFSDGKHYKVRFTNDGEDLSIKLYEPDSSNIKWRDLNLNRRCNCHSGGGNAITACNNAFSNSAVSSLTAIENFSKSLKKMNVKNCNNLSCATETNPPVDICFLYDGSSPLDKHFKVFESNDLSLIIKMNKTGYAEE